MWRKRVLALAVVLVALNSCGDGGSVDQLTAPSGDEPSFLISDAAHPPGRAGFYFRPPLVPDASPFPGTFDANQFPVAQVCRLSAAAPHTCTTTIIATFNGGTGPTALTADTREQSYNALWKTPKNLTQGQNKYRLEVNVGTTLLGYLDFWFVKNSKELQAAMNAPNADQYVIAIAGNNVPIKFRIETGTIGTISVEADPDQITGSGSSTITATVKDLHDQPMSGVLVEWESSDTDVATVSPTSSSTNGSGQATTTASTATTGGTTDITASSGGAEGSTTLTVVLNAAPVAEDDDYTVVAGATLTAPSTGPPAIAGLLDNDNLGVPAASGISSINVGSLGTPISFAGGQLTVNANGSFTLAEPTEAGEHTFTYTLDNGIPPTSTATVTITVTPAAASKLAISTQPSSAAQSAVEFAQQPVIQVQDEFGNAVSQAGIDVTAEIATGTGTLNGTTTATTGANGQAGFTNLSITGTAGDFTLSFSATDLGGATSNTITLGAGAPAKLTFVVQPSNATAGVAISPAVQVTVQDAGGNTVATATNTITVAIGTNPGGGVLSGTASVAAVAGVATFNNLSIDKAGTGYTLTANSGVLTAATSGAFDITAAAVDHFSVQAQGGGDIGTQAVDVAFSIQITAFDAFDNVATSFTGTVDVTAAGASLSAGSGTSAAFTAGILASHSVTFGTAGDPVTLTATRTGGSEAGTSNEFRVEGPPTAVDDTDPTVTGGTSSPGSTIYHIAFETTTNGNINVLDNDNLGIPVAHTRTFGNIQLNGGTAIGGAITDNNFDGSAVDLGNNGSLAVASNGDVNLTAPDGFTGLITFDYELTNTIDSDQATVTIAVGARPVANADEYPNALVGNISIDTETGTPYTVLANDGGDAKTVAIVTASATNGEVTLNADGTFTFNPAAGFKGGNGTFQYTVSNGFGTSAAATVTIPVGTQVIWFINNGAGACTTLAGGCGRLSNPFSTLAAFQAINASGTGNNPADNHHVFVYQSATGYTGGVTLRSGQRLIGQDASSTLLSLTGVTLPPHSPSLPAMNSGDATMTTFDGATGGITLNSGNHLHGFTAAPSTGSGVLGASVGSLVVRDVAVNAAAGPAVDLTTGTVDAVFTSVSSAGSATRGVNLDGINGTVSLQGGAITNATGEAFRISGGAANVTYNGTITNSAGRSVEVLNRTGIGTVTFTGGITDTGTGILLNANSAGTTTTFRGGMTLSTGTSAAFTATSGGVLNVCDESPCNPAATGVLANTLTTTTGTALNVANTAIGANNLEFRSITSNGAASGIVLNNTGGLGGLSVKGTGGAGTGGTIQSSTGPGISLTTTTGVSLASMNVTGGGDDGIRGSSVTGLSLTGVQVTSNGNAAGEAGIDLTNLLGNSTWSSLTVSGSAEDNVVIRNSSGTLNGLTVTGSTFSNNSAIGNDGFLVEASGTATMTVSVTGSNFSAHRGDHFQGAAVNSGVLDVVFSSNILTGGHATALGQGITINAATGVPGFAGTVNYNLNNNTINGSILSAITANLGTSAAESNMRGTINGNSIGTVGSFQSGSTQASGITVEAHGNGTHTTSVTNNTIRQTFDRGINVLANDGGGTLNMTVTGNELTHSDGVNSRESFFLNNGSTDPNIFGLPDSHFVCLTLGGAGALRNTLTHGPGAPDDFRLRQRFNSTIRLPGYGGSATDTGAVVAFVNGNNLSATGSATVNSPPGGGFVGGAACPQPTFP